MWNLLSLGQDANIYQPSSLTGTYVTADAAYAYDKPSGLYDDYPYETAATLKKVSSGTAGTGETVTAILSGFPALSKSAFTSLNLNVAISLFIIPHQYAATDVSTSSVSIEISYDAGTSWNPWKTYGIYKNGIRYPFTAACYTILATDVITQDIANMAMLSATIPSSSLAVGLSSVQVRFSGSAVKSTVDGVGSESEIYVWDVRATVA